MSAHIAVGSTFLIIAASFWLVVIRVRQMLLKMNEEKKEVKKEIKEGLIKQESICMGTILLAGAACILCIFIQYNR